MSSALAIHSHWESLLLAPTLGPQHCCLCLEGTKFLLCAGARGIGPHLNSQLVVGSWGQRFLLLLQAYLKHCSQSSISLHFLSLNCLQRLKPVWFTSREKAHGEIGKQFHVRYIARRICNAGALINVQKMTSRGHEELWT